MTDRAGVEGLGRVKLGVSYRSLPKRVLDLFLVIAFAPAIVLLVMALAMAVRRDGGPAFFGHERVGRDGRRFRCWKLRTMVTDADLVLRRHLASDARSAAEWERDQKLTDDPRVTRLGRILRATSLDELPQLWNVAVGEMSLVGPRPVTPAELERYRGHRDDYQSVRPGVTGLWQVSGRNDVSYDERVALDVRYAQDCSLGLDVTILVRTVDTVVRRTGR